MVYRCPVCGVEFSRPANKVSCSEPTCSRACHHKKKTTGKTVPCSYCGLPVHVERRKLEKFENHFCSQECRRKFSEGKTVPCSWCGKPVHVSKNRLERFENHFCSQECYGDFLSKTTKGIIVKETVKWYRRMSTKTGRKPIHRLIAEICLGRSLPSSLVVHHVNGNKFDNHIANLEVYTRADHAGLHMGVEVKPIWSGRDFLESLQNRPRKLHKLRKSLIGNLGQVDVDQLLQLS